MASSSRAGPVVVLAAAAWLATLAAPLAAADHAYSHRYIIYGRVVDAEGAPLVGVQVSASIDRQEIEGQCDVQKPPATRSTTDSLGEYFWCFHTHRMGGTGVFTVRAENETRTADLDTDLRKSRVDFRVPTDVPGKHGDLDRFNTSYALTLTAWKPGATSIEGISVEGTALRARAFVATFRYNDGKERSTNATTNDYGDATFSVNLGEPLRSGTVVVTAQRGATAAGAMDTTFHASTLVFMDPPAPWYTDEGLLGGAIVLALVGAAAVAYGAWRWRTRSSAPKARGRRTRR